MLTKTDCFAYITKGNKPGCSALKAEAARCEGCTFYKTSAEREREIAATERRLTALEKTYLLLPRRADGRYA